MSDYRGLTREFRVVFSTRLKVHILAPLGPRPEKLTPIFWATLSRPKNTFPLFGFPLDEESLTLKPVPPPQTIFTFSFFAPAPAPFRPSFTLRNDLEGLFYRGSLDTSADVFLF